MTSGGKAAVCDATMMNKGRKAGAIKIPVY